jgi:hypothetical protein
MRKNQFVLAVPLVTLFCSGCFVPDCENIVGATSPSPDRAYVASAYSVDCGAVGSFNLYVALEDASRAPGKKTTMLRLDGPVTAKLEWTGPRSLHVTIVCQREGFCPEESWDKVRPKLPSGKAEWNGVTIQYALDTKAAP